jgi:hypothetical protein
MTMQEKPTADAVVAAYSSLVERGDMPSVRAVHAEMQRLRGEGASMRDIVPVVARLRAKSQSDRRVERVVRLYLALDPVARREALRRIEEETKR